MNFTDRFKISIPNERYARAVWIQAEYLGFQWATREPDWHRLKDGVFVFNESHMKISLYSFSDKTLSEPSYPVISLQAFYKMEPEIKLRLNTFSATVYSDSVYAIGQFIPLDRIIELYEQSSFLH